MEAEVLKKLQNTELKILEAVTNFCEKNGITYFLDSGTLIGAIRHDGFIPWDDDIDIAMPYPDYCRFLEIAQAGLGADYYIQNYLTEDHFYKSYTKVCLNNTWVMPPEWKAWDIHHGAWVDIFPMFYSDSESDIRKKARIYKAASILQEQNYYRNCIICNGRNLKLTIGYIILSFLRVIPMKTRKKIHTRMLRKIFAEQDGRYLCRCAIIVRKFEKSSYMGPKCYHKFEHLSLRIPNDYDKVLRTEYGDYMQLPPEDKRGNHGSPYFDIEVRV